MVCSSQGGMQQTRRSRGIGVHGVSSTQLQRQQRRRVSVQCASRPVPTWGISMMLTPPAAPAADSAARMPLWAMCSATRELLQAVSVLMQGPCGAEWAVETLRHMMAASANTGR